MKDALELEFLDRMKRFLVFIAGGTSFTIMLLRVNCTSRLNHCVILLIQLRY